VAWHSFAPWPPGEADKLGEEQAVGVAIVTRACEEPAVRLRPMPVRKARSSCSGSGRKGAFGYNAQTDVFEDLVEAGVIDPPRFVRSALQNAASVAGLLITTQALIVEAPKEDKPAPGGHGGWRDGRDGWHGRHGRHD